MKRNQQRILAKQRREAKLLEMEGRKLAREVAKAKKEEKAAAKEKLQALYKLKLKQIDEGAPKLTTTDDLTAWTLSENKEWLRKMANENSVMFEEQPTMGCVDTTLRMTGNGLKLRLTEFSDSMILVELSGVERYWIPSGVPPHIQSALITGLLGHLIPPPEQNNGQDEGAMDLHDQNLHDQNTRDDDNGPIIQDAPPVPHQHSLIPHQHSPAPHQHSESPYNPNAPIFRNTPPASPNSTNPECSSSSEYTPNTDYSMSGSSSSCDCDSSSPCSSTSGTSTRKMKNE